MKCSIASGSISSQKPKVLFSNSAVKVHDSQAYRNVEMTTERISFTCDSRDMLLSLQMGFSFVRAVVACAILERTSGLEPSSETTAPRYLKLVTVPNFCPFTIISIWKPLALFVISWSSRPDLHLIPLCKFCLDFLLEILAPAFPQLEHLCHRQTADW